MQKLASLAILSVSTEAVKTKTKHDPDYIGALVEHAYRPNAEKFVVKLGEDQRPKFVQWAAATSHHYNSQEEMEEAERNFKITNEEILRDNAKADASGDPHAARHDHNIFSAMSLE